MVSVWGTLSAGGSTSNDLRETTVKIVEVTDAPNRITNTRMCAYTEGTDSCQGDSGGPIVVKEDGRYTEVGVVSYGKGLLRRNMLMEYMLELPAFWAGSTQMLQMDGVMEQILLQLLLLPHLLLQQIQFQHCYPNNKNPLYDLV